MKKQKVVELIGIPFFEIPDFDNSFKINHCVWQRYSFVERGVIKNKYIIVNFKNDSLVKKEFNVR